MSVRLFGIALLSLVVVGCTDDGDDGKVSELTTVEISDAGSAALEMPALVTDGAVSAYSVSLICRKAVISEHSLEGFSVSVRDATGPVANTFVAISPSTGVLLSREIGGDVTDRNGVINFGFEAPHFDTPTLITLDASVRDAAGKIAASARCTFQLATEGLAFVMPEADSVVAYGKQQAVTLRVVAQDVIPSCAMGGGVHIASLGISHANFATSATDPAAPSRCLDVPSNGDVMFFARGTDSGGTARIEATAGDYRAELPLQVIGAPASIALKSDSTDLNVNSAANLMLSVLDDVGQGVAGVPVRVSIGRCAESTCMAGESIAPADVVTNGTGAATSAYFSGSVPGAAQINAVVTDRPKVAAMTVLRVR